jgi:hypothetical protein
VVQHKSGQVSSSGTYQKKIKNTSHYKKIYDKVIREAKKLTNNMRISSSENKSKTMWDIVKVELGNQKKAKENIEISENGKKHTESKGYSKRL